MGISTKQPFRLFWCKHAVWVSILDLKQQLCILSCLVLLDNFFGVQTVHILSFPLQLIAASFFICWIQVSLQLLGFFLAENVFFFDFAASSLHRWICAFSLINISIQDSGITGTKTSLFLVFDFQNCVGVVHTLITSTAVPSILLHQLPKFMGHLPTGWSKMNIHYSSSVVSKWYIFSFSTALTSTGCRSAFDKIFQFLEIVHVSSVFSKLFIVTDSSPFPKRDKGLYCSTTLDMMYSWITFNAISMPDQALVGQSIKRFFLTTKCMVISTPEYSSKSF